MLNIRMSRTPIESSGQSRITSDYFFPLFLVINVASVFSTGLTAQRHNTARTHGWSPFSSESCQEIVLRCFI